MMGITKMYTKEGFFNEREELPKKHTIKKLKDALKPKPI
jgi:hypothetical protein